MPVPPQVGCVARHHDQMAEAGSDLLLAAWAQVALTGLVGLDRQDLHVFVRHEPSMTASKSLAMFGAGGAP